MKHLLLFFIFGITAINGYSQATSLFFSEYIEGSSSNKYLEIYNGTGADVDLSGYVVVLYANGVTEATQTLALTGTLTNGDVYVIANSSATVYTGTINITSAVTYYNGDDAIALMTTSGEYVDIIGCVGERASWSDGDYSLTDHTLIRKSTVTSGISVNPTTGFPTLSTEWDLYDKDDVSHLGSYPVTTTDVATSNSIDELKVYPNPFSSFIAVEGSNINSILLTNITGEVVKYLNGDGGDKVTISTSELAVGIYIIKITELDGRSTIQKLIKK